MAYIAVILLGLCLGSFVNAVVWRIHEQDHPVKMKKKSSKLKSNELSIMHGRSMCPHCHHTLQAIDLIPVLSWVSLGGKCRYCRVKINPQYPFVELLAAVLLVVSLRYWPMSFNTVGTIIFALWTLQLTALLALAVYDQKWGLLPNRIVFPLIALSVATVLVRFVDTREWMVIGDALLGLLAVGGLFFVLYNMSEKWIGGGDVKLGYALGLLAGSLWQGLLVVFLASLLGSLIALPLLAAKKMTKKSRMPFGPLLILATYVAVIWGAGIVDAYTRLIGL